MPGWNMPLKRELVERGRLINLPLTHHRFKSPAHTGGTNQSSSSASTGDFFNAIRQNQTLRSMSTFDCKSSKNRKTTRIIFQNQSPLRSNATTGTVGKWCAINTPT
jgi:hypothetical protein